MTEARSSSERFRKVSQYMGSPSPRPSWPTPSRIARASMSSVQLPAPVSASGVRLGATMRPSSLSQRTAPLNSRPGIGG